MMRTLLRHTRTGLFFQGPDRWIGSPEQAYDFRFTERALQYIAAWDLREVELAFEFEDTRAVTTAGVMRPAAQHAVVREA